MRGERLGLRRDLVVDRAVARVDAAAAERLLVDLLDAEAVDHRRAGDEQLARPPHHEGVVAGHHPRRAEAGDRAEAEADDRHPAEVGHDPLPAGVEGDERPSFGLERLDAAPATRSVDESDDREAEVVRHALGHHLLLEDRRIRGAAANGEVVAAHHHGSVVDAAASHHEVGGHHRRDGAGVVAGRAPGERADLAEAGRVQERVDALAHRELALGAVTFHLLGAAHLLGELTPVSELVELRLPRRGCGVAHGRGG